MPSSDFSGLPAVPNHSYTESLYPLVQGLSPCDSLMEEFTVTGHISYEVFDQLEPGFHSRSTPQSPHEDVGLLFTARIDG